MTGIDELTAKEAVAIVGAKAYLRRCEFNTIATGLRQLAELTGEKAAASVPYGLLDHMMLPAALGAGVAIAPKLLTGEPTQDGELLRKGLTGAALGGLAGGGYAVHRAMQNPALSRQFATALARH